MIKSDLLHNKQTFKYILYIALFFSLLLAVIIPLQNFRNGKYILPIYITSPSIKEVLIEAYNQYNELIPTITEDGKKALFNQYIYTISVSSSTPFSLHTKEKIILLHKERNDINSYIKRQILPINLSITNLISDTIYTFLLSLIKYFVILFLILYLIVDRINYSTEITFRANKLTISNTVSFNEFIMYLLISIFKLARDILQNRYLLAGLGMLLLTNTPLLVCVYIRQDNLDLNLFILHSIHKLLFDPVFYALVFALLLKIFRFKLIPISILTLGIFMNLADAAVYYFGFTISEKNHATLITPYSVLGFLSPQLIVLIALLFISLIPINYCLIRGLKKTNSNKLAVIVLFFYFVNLPSIFFPVFSLFNTYSATEISNIEKNDDLRYSHENSLINFFAEMFFYPVFNVPHDLDIKKFKEVAEYYNLPYGKRSRGLNVPKPDHIVMIANESLSLDLITAHNPAIRPDNSGIWAFDDIISKTATNYYTTGHNTLQGLISTFNSHPNFTLMTEGKKFYFNNSFVKKLADDGYKTIFLRSASKYFANEDVIFSALGFQEIIALEDFAKESSEYIHAWGLMDRIIFNKLSELLDTYKNKKVFIMTLGVDTHPLDGRKSFLDLQYPFDNSTFKAYKGSEFFLKSVANMNYDLKNLYTELKNNGQFDDKTCFIYTADHACPLNPAVANIPDYPQTSLARIPLVIDYKWINNYSYINKLSSQIDLAPTILDIAGIDYPQSYWGDSIFSPDKKEIFVGFDQERIYIRSRGSRFAVHIKNPRNYYEKKLVKYFKFIADK